MLSLWEDSSALVCVFVVEGRWWKHTVQAYLWPTAARLTVNSPKNTQVSFLGPARTAWFITGSHAWWRCSHLAFHFLGRLKGCDLFLYAQRSTIYPQPKWKNIQSRLFYLEKSVTNAIFCPQAPADTQRETPEWFYFPLQRDWQSILRCVRVTTSSIA